MEYKVGEVFFDEELHANVRCVKDEVKNGCLQSCSHCIFSENYMAGAPCPPRSYNEHPCYHSEREDGQDVHFEKVHKPIKPVDLLKWIVSECIETESMDIIEVDELFDFERFFGYIPEERVPFGKYLYMYSDCADSMEMSRLITDEECMPYVITTQEKDRKNEKALEIYLFKLED